ncbi:MAG: dihydroorotase [Verrucomicrobia bacterium]|nr:MAG: dihydroorotase [Verrucomicrobiota bacterium]
MTTKTTLLKSGRIIDPANRRDEIGDLLIVDGRIAEPSEVRDLKSEISEIDCAGLVIAPGLIDLHVHLREPGQSAKETIASGAKAAAAGGFTSIVCMPNTSPSIDSPSVVTWILEKAKAEACVNIFPTGAITKGIAGEELAPIGSMFKAGIVALTDDGRCIQNHEVMRRALEYAGMFGLTVMDHCQDYNLVGKGVMHEGAVSTALGLPGWPAAGEEIIVQRNALLAELTGTPIHCQHLSSGGSVRLLREARARGVKLSGEICPHHIALTDESVRGFDTNFKMNPPLRTQRDIDLLIEGVADGTITVLASDHAPHCAYEKEVEFDLAPFGILGLETELGLFLDILVHKKKAISLARLIEMFTTEPARLLRLDRGTLSVGAPADVTIIDPGLEWTVDKEQSFSRSRNTPFHGWELKGRAVRTIVAGETVWKL